jgi:dienelactone hydrolase
LSLGLALLALLAGCGTAVAQAGPGERAVARPAARTRVLVRTLHLSRAPDRPLVTTIWYPAGTTGPHPIVLFSHGLGGLPAQFAPLAAGWVEAGFVVAAPAYPHTNARVRTDRQDVRRQPADAGYVLARVKALDGVEGDVLAGRLDVGRVAAVGFSAGGTTTLGLLRAGHDPALRAAISVSGRPPASPFGGPAVPVLLVHGDRDRVVPIGAGEDAYAAVPWAKRFVVVRGGGHGQFLRPGNKDYPRIAAMILDFLRERLDL